MEKSIILFDGVCNLCNGFIQFAVRHNSREDLYFSSLQSEFSQNILKDSGLLTGYIDSLVFYVNGKVYTKSGAALRIAKRLDGIWPVFSVLLIIPAPVRDFIYDFIAGNRYKWFGKKDQCMIPAEKVKSRFL